MSLELDGARFAIKVGKLSLWMQVQKNYLFSVKNAFVDFGGSSIIGMGHHPYGDCWKVGFDSPETGVRLRDFRLYDSSLSTSGNTPSYSGHIVNPLTGVANRRKMAATVVAGDSLDAEVLSTVWMIASPEQRRQIAELSADVEANIYEL